jgi:hypothetical protein
MGEAVDGMDKAASANDGLSEADRRFNAAMGF